MLNKREFPGVLVSQLLNRVNSTASCCALLPVEPDFREVSLVRCLQSFRGLVVLLLADFLRSQRRIQILNILFIAGVLSRFREKLLLQPRP
jgi:hypothetical protein